MKLWGPMKDRMNKAEKMKEYTGYLDYRKGYRNKLSFQEYKKNHKHKYIKWAKRQWAIKMAKYYSGCDPIKNLVYKPRSIGATGAKMSQAEKELKKQIFNQKYPKTWDEVFKTKS
jgi:hypothetical protein